MQDQQKSLTVRKGVDAYHLGDYIGYYCNPSTASIRKSFYCSLAGLALLLLSFVFTPLILHSVNAANLVQFGADWGQVSLELDPDVAATEEYEASAGASGSTIGDSGHGDVDFGTITPTEASGSNYGTLRILKKTVGVTTNGKYFSVYLSTTGTTNSLNREGDTNIAVPAVTTNTSEGSAGTWASPASFSQEGWGFAVPGTNITTDGTTTASLPSFGYLSTVDLATIENKLGVDIIPTDGGQLYTSSRWAAVPVKANAQQVYKASTSNQNGFGTYTITNLAGEDVSYTGDTNNTFDVYYGLAVSTNVMAGNYNNTIVYTVLASSASLDQVSHNLAWNYKYGGQGDTETIDFDLTESTDVSTISQDNLHVYLVPHNVIAANNYDVTGLDSDDYAACTITTIIMGQSNGKLTCTMPAEMSYDASITSGDNGAYDFWLHIDGYNYNYLSKLNNGTDSAFKYVGLQTTDDQGNRLVTTMQEMTSGICKQTNRWNKLWGKAARIYDNDGYSAEATPLASTTAASAAEGLGSFSLRDTRDGKMYLVRRLGDGNCWMVQNLDLELYSGMTLTAADTDLGNGSGSKDTWNVYDGTALSSNVNTTATNVGSLSASWQANHQISTVRLYKGEWTTTTDEETGETTGAWQETLVTECTDGTPETPCYATTANATVSFDGIASAGTKTTYTIRKIVEPTGTSNYSSIAIDSLGNGSSCSYTVSNSAYKLTDGVYDASGTATPNVLLDAEGYCRIETEGEDQNGVNVGTMITQPSVMTGNTVGGTISAVLSTGVETPDITKRNPSYFGWTGGGSDGAHVYDPGPVRHVNSFSNAVIDGVSTAVNMNTVPYQTPSATSDYGLAALVEYNRGVEEGSEIVAGEGLATYIGKASGVSLSSASYSVGICSSTNYGGYTIGTTQGTLKDPGGVAYEFISCGKMENGVFVPKADYGLAGNYYSWYAATAGSGTSYRTSGTAVDSICPKGWRLPYGGLYSDLLTSSRGYGISSSSAKDAGTVAMPLNFYRTDFYSNSNANLQKNLGTSNIADTLWLSSAQSASDAYNLALWKDYVSAGYHNNKASGRMIRCVAR